MAEQDAILPISEHVSVLYRRRGESSLWDRVDVQGPWDPGTEKTWWGLGARPGASGGKLAWVEVGMEGDPEDPTSIIAEAVTMADECFRETHPGAFIAP